MLDPFEEFLRRESSKVRARRIGSATFIEEERPERRYHLPTDFIDALFLRSEPGEHITVEKSLIREMRYRLEELENEIKRLRIRKRVLEIALIATLIALILSFIR
ncbi:MAG: hypothetical protein QXJ38_01030 [Thermofilaceae archaeon]